jgi:hypothetical protein
MRAPVQPGLPDFSRHNVPKQRKIYQIKTKFPNGHWIYQYFPFQCPPKLNQIGIFGFKINNLATLSATATLPTCVVIKKSYDF